jgi:hypothetical protein
VFFSIHVLLGLTGRVLLFKRVPAPVSDFPGKQLRITCFVAQRFGQSQVSLQEEGGTAAALWEYGKHDGHGQRIKNSKGRHWKELNFRPVSHEDAALTAELQCPWSTELFIMSLLKQKTISNFLCRT